MIFFRFWIFSKQYLKSLPSFFHLTQKFSRSIRCFMNFVYFWPFGGVSLRRAKTSFSFNLTHSLKIENLRKIVKNDPDFRLSARLLYFFSCFTQGMCLSDHVIFKIFHHVTCFRYVQISLEFLPLCIGQDVCCRSEFDITIQVMK